MSAWRALPIGQAAELAGERHALDWSWSMHDAHTIAEQFGWTEISQRPRRVTLDIGLGPESGTIRAKNGQVTASNCNSPTSRTRPRKSRSQRLSTTSARRSPQGSASRPRARSEEHTSELQSLMRISYAVFCLKKKKTHINKRHNT